MSEALQSRRILVVEDEPDIREAYQDILTPKAAKASALKSSRAKPVGAGVGGGGPSGAGAGGSARTSSDGFEVILVGTGEKALEEVRKSIDEKRPFAMGFFDVLLGEGIDGIETVKRIHELNKDLYAVLVTAYQDRHVDAIQSIFGKEFEDRWDYLNKPFSEGEILQKARNMVSMWNIRQHDLFQRQRLDELKEKLNENEKNLTVAAVARSVGHEFGNILLQIMGRADLAKSRAEPEMKQALETILVATEHASKVLERFKNLAKPTEAHGLRPLDVKKPIDETLLLISHELRRKNVATVVELQKMPEIQGSHTTLVQVFMNLVINALHAMNNGGKLEFRGRVAGDEIEIKIRDSGPGIPDEYIEKVFQPFFTTKGDKGTGLGLAICKEIIEISHGGHLTAGNHPEGGAEFTIKLPVHGGGEGHD